MRNLDPEIRRFLLWTISDTFAEIRKSIEHGECNQEKIKQGILELCAALNIDLQEVPPPKVPTVKQRICSRCKRQSINSKLWSQGERLCSYCRQDDFRKMRTNEKKSNHGWSKISENVEKDFTP